MGTEQLTQCQHGSTAPQLPQLRGDVGSRLRGRSSDALQLCCGTNPRANPPLKAEHKRAVPAPHLHLEQPRRPKPPLLPAARAELCLPLPRRSAVAMGRAGGSPQLWGLAVCRAVISSVVSFTLFSKLAAIPCREGESIRRIYYRLSLKFL